MQKTNVYVSVIKNLNIPDLKRQFKEDDVW